MYPFFRPTVILSLIAFYRLCSCWSRLGSICCARAKLRSRKWCWLWPWTGQQRQLWKRLRGLPSVTHFRMSFCWTSAIPDLGSSHRQRMRRKEGRFAAFIRPCLPPFYMFHIDCFYIFYSLFKPSQLLYYDWFLNCHTTWIFKRMFSFQFSRASFFEMKFVCYHALKYPKSTVDLTWSLCYHFFSFLDQLSTSLINSFFGAWFEYAVNWMN